MSDTSQEWLTLSQHRVTHSSQSCCGDQCVCPGTNEDNAEAQRGLRGSEPNSSAVTTATWGTQYAGHCAVSHALHAILSPSSQQPLKRGTTIIPDSLKRKRTEFKEPDTAEPPYCLHSMCPSPPSPFLCGGGCGYQRRPEEGWHVPPGAVPSCPLPRAHPFLLWPEQ